MPDYSKGKIYTIRCHNDNTLIYVGSTTQPLSKRWGGHKVDSKKHTNILIYSTICDNWTDWYIELYEEYPCENKEQLEKREGEIIREIGTLNQRINGRTKKEYQKEYRQQNKDEIREKDREYRQQNKDEIREKRRENHQQIKEKSKTYYEDNKDKINEKHKTYYENNEDKINKQRTEYRQRKKLENQ